MNAIYLQLQREKKIKVQHFNTRTKAENEPSLILTTTYKKRLEISKVVISSRNSKRYKRKEQEDKH